MSVPQSTLLAKFLKSKRVQKALSLKPGQQGFSLIELVVVIAILGILIAIALPNFLGVQKDAKINQAKNTLATIVKECAVKGVRFGSDTVGVSTGTGASALVQAAAANLNDYSITLGIASTDGLMTSSANADCMEAYPRNDTGNLPTFGIETDNSGATTKQCWAGADYNSGCFASAGLLTEVSSVVGTAGSW